MDIKSLQDKKRKLGASIMRQILTFERETGCQIDAIEIERSSLINVNSRQEDDRRRLKYVGVRVSV